MTSSRRSGRSQTFFFLVLLDFCVFRSRRPAGKKLRKFCRENNIQVEAYDRVGLLRDITTVVAEEKVNITSVTTQYNDDVFTMFATIEIKNMGQLNHLMSRIMTRDVKIFPPGVASVRRY